MGKQVRWNKGLKPNSAIKEIKKQGRSPEMLPVNWASDIFRYLVAPALTATPTPPTLRNKVSPLP